MIRCRHCLAKAEPRNGRCSLCGILHEQKGRTLSPDEKKVRFHARCIRVVAMFHLLAAALSLLLMPDFPSPTAFAVLIAVNLFLAFGLARYSLIAYKAATSYYFLIGMVNVISIQQGIEHLAGIALVLIALYLVGNSTAKAIFERRFLV